MHCHLRWDFVWQRPQQLFSRLAEHHPVLFIEDPLPDGGEARLDLSEPFPNVVRMVPRLPLHAPSVKMSTILGPPSPACASSDMCQT